MPACPQCLIDNTSILCRGCNRFLSDDAMEIDEFLVEMPIPPTPLRVATAWAHIGDTIACMSYAKHVLDMKGQANCSFIYTGPCGHIVEFLKAQPWVKQVWAGKHDEGFQRAYQLACNEMSDPAMWMPIIATNEKGFPSAADVTPTHPSFLQSKLYRAVPIKGLKLPEASVAWAREWWERTFGAMSNCKLQIANVKSGGGSRMPVIMIHPASVWSETAVNHWPHWREAIRWLLECTPHTYILTGLVEGFGVKHERLIDMVGKTPSFCEMLAIAEMCDGVVSTPNCVSLWTVAQDIPGLICGNKAMDNLAYFFRRYVDRIPNRFIETNAPFSEFQRVAAAWTVAPRTYVEVLKIEEGCRRDRRASRALQDGAGNGRDGGAMDARMQRTYRVTGGIVAGKKKDYYRGEIVRAIDFNGDPAVLVGLGVVEACDSA